MNQLVLDPPNLRLRRGANGLGARARCLAWALIAGGLTMAAGCRREAPSSDRKQPASASASTVSGASSTVRTAEGPRPAPDAPVTLLEWKESGYGTSLFIDGSTVLVLTQTAAIRVNENAPPQKWTMPFGVGPARMGDSIVHWHDGAARAVSKAGSEPRTLGRIEHRPQRFVASEKRLAWLERSEAGAFSLKTFDGTKPRVLYRTEQPIATATMREDKVFFVERQASGSWRIGRVSVSDGATAFSPPHPGRTPSMLAAAPDGIYFYDGPTRSVRRSSADLQSETVFAEKVICSPLAVSDRVVCGHAEGVYEIPGKGRPPRVLSREAAGPIAAIAADEKRAVWVVDTAENQFAVRSVALPPLP